MAGEQLNPVAVSGFTSGADAYERARPGYPTDLVEALRTDGGLVADAVVLDLAAGTGKLTRLLLGDRARVVAVEPVTAMAAGLRASVPGVPVASGLAEALPSPTARWTCSPSLRGSTGSTSPPRSPSASGSSGRAGDWR